MLFSTQHWTCVHIKPAHVKYLISEMNSLIHWLFFALIILHQPRCLLLILLMFEFRQYKNSSYLFDWNQRVLSDSSPAWLQQCVSGVPSRSASSVGAAPLLSDDQVGNHWSEQINSQRLHLLATLCGLPSVCVSVCLCVHSVVRVCVCVSVRVCLHISCPKSSREPISAHQVVAIWVLPLNTQHAFCVGSVLNAWKHKFAW